jgi:glycerol-3-phosphate dehydrogenase
MTRQEILDAIRRKPEVSVLIIGGGINGAGLFRELALQGADVLLVEKSDFCAGASAASGRVIHGGLRYLENSEFRLVRESLRERKRLLANAPHYVKPLAATIPIYSWTGGLLYAIKQFLGLPSKPGDRGALILKVGLTLYDLLAGKQPGLSPHRFEWRRAALERRPQINPHIVCTATYYDAKLTYAERLCLELVLDAEAFSPQAEALNYVRAYGAAGDIVTLQDVISGEMIEVKPKIVVNATGAWIDFTNHALQRDTQFIGGTKGSHLVVDHQDLWNATQGQMFHFVSVDGRLTIFYPIGDKVIIGTTDIRAEDPEAAVCDDDEVDYLLKAVSRVFPDIQLSRSNIVFRLCGVRPLPRSDTASTEQISRDHSCPLVPPGNGTDFPIYSLVSGKWTTFRAFAEQVTDRLLQALNRTRVADSTDLKIGGGKSYPQTDAEKQQWIARCQNKTGLDSQRIRVLLERYGTRAEAVAEFITAGDDRPLWHCAEYSQREILFIASYEKVAHLDDLVLRRTLMGLLGQLNRDLLGELAVAMSPVLSWSPQKTCEEVERAMRILEQRHGVVLGAHP